MSKRAASTQLTADSAHEEAYQVEEVREGWSLSLLIWCASNRYLTLLSCF